MWWDEAGHVPSTTHHHGNYCGQQWGVNGGVQEEGGDLGPGPQNLGEGDLGSSNLPWENEGCS